MSIIDDTYFIMQADLPTDNPDRVGKLQTYIDTTEKEYLINALGYELYKLFSVELPNPVTARYVDIINGAEFTNKHDRLDKWDGLKNDEKESFLAYFTYFNYSRGVFSSQTGHGITMSAFENSENVSPINREVIAYNLGIERYNKLYEFLKANEDVYPEWHFTELKRVNVLNI